MNNIKKYVIIICCLLLTNISLARHNNPEDFKTIVKKGQCSYESGVFETKDDGQLYIQKKDDFELRLKQNTLVAISKNPLALTDELELEKGLIGLKVASDTLYIKTKFADLRLRNASVVIKLSNNLVRVCVLEGTAVFIHKANFISVNSGSEIAASSDRLSNIYKYLDDLRFVWYWKSPNEEPSLLDE